MTSEEKLCCEEHFQNMLLLAKNGIKELIRLQKNILSN